MSESKRRMMEIVGPPTFDAAGRPVPGTVHFRRPEGHLMITLALGMPGYSVRPMDPVVYYEDFVAMVKRAAASKRAELGEDDR